MKKNKGSGGFEPELATDGLFDLSPRAAIILRKLVYRFSRFVTFGLLRRVRRDEGALPTARAASQIWTNFTLGDGPIENV
jgi:hypothetical protein